MAGESSFDVVSDFDEQELRNALDQVRREVQTRYDFKGVTVELTQGKTELTLLTDDELGRRPSVTSSNQRRSAATCRSRSSTGARSKRRAGTRSARRSACGAACRTTAKRLTKLIRDEFPKVKSQIQGDSVRVSGKSKDDLQKVITRLRELDEPVPLQFQNYR